VYMQYRRDVVDADRSVTDVLRERLSGS